MHPDNHRSLSDEVGDFADCPLRLELFDCSNCGATGAANANITKTSGVIE